MTTDLTEAEQLQIVNDFCFKIISLFKDDLNIDQYSVKDCRVIAMNIIGAMACSLGESFGVIDRKGFADDIKQMILSMFNEGQKDLH